MTRSRLGDPRTGELGAGPPLVVLTLASACRCGGCDTEFVEGAREDALVAADVEGPAALVRTHRQIVALASGRAPLVLA